MVIYNGSLFGGFYMKIMVSACLLGRNCKYNGGNNFNPKVLDFIEGHDVVPICPEVTGGLPIPRVPSEIVNGIVINKDGINVDYEFRTGAKIEFNKALSENVDLVILQSRSPSCGPKQIYDGTFSKHIIDAQGVFAKMLIDHGFKVIDIEDL